MPDSIVVPYAGTTGTTNTGTITAAYTWQIWTTGNVTTSTVAPIIWESWCQSTGGATISAYVGNNLADATWQAWQLETTRFGPPLSAEQQAERDRVALDRQERYAAHQAAQAIANVRARSLLDEFLDETQKAELETHKQFHVVGSKGRRYCIRGQGQSGNVDLLRADGSVQARLCAHPSDYLPDGDAWLSQMLHLTSDEDRFLRTANIQRGDLAGII